MHVLVTEAHFGDAAEVVRRLRESRCHVSLCHTESGLCRALAAGSACPLDRIDSPDLLVDVRSVDPEMTAREFGAVCALRERVPVVITDVDPEREPTVPEGLRSRVTAAVGAELLSACASWQRSRAAGGRS